MPRTDGFTRLWPSLFYLVFIAVSMYLLALAVRTAAYGMLFLHEDAGVGRLLSLPLIVAGIVGLKLLATPVH